MTFLVLLALRPRCGRCVAISTSTSDLTRSGLEVRLCFGIFHLTATFFGVLLRVEDRHLLSGHDLVGERLLRKNATRATGRPSMASTKAISSSPTSSIGAILTA